MSMTPREKSIETIIADLETKYEETINEPSKNNFFLKIADYGKYLLESKILASILKPLPRQAKEDLENYNEKRDSFIEKWKQLVKDILGKVEKTGIKDHPTSPFINQINQLKGRFDQVETSYFEENIDYFYQPYQELIDKFRKEGKVKLIKNHISEDRRCPMLFKKYNEACTEWGEFKRLRENAVWWAHYNIERLACGVLGLERAKSYFKRDNYIDDMYGFEFKQITKGNSSVFLRKKRFEKWLKRLHRFLIPRLESYRKTLSESKERHGQLINEIKDGTKDPTIHSQEDAQEHRKLTLPSGCKLVEEDNLLKIRKNKTVIFTFPNNWSNKCRYFKCLWENYGIKMSYKETYEFNSNLKYPEKSVWRLNRNMRGTINKLRKEFKNKNLPLSIETNKGFTLIIS